MAISEYKVSWREAVLPGDFLTQTRDSERSARDWVVDCGLFAICVAFGVIAVIDDQTLWLLNAIAGAVTSISLFWRRSYPFEVGLLGSIASCVAGAAGAAWLVILYNSALRLDRKSLTAVIAISAIGFVTYPFLYPSDELGLLAYTVLGIGVAGTAFGLGVLARARREHVLALIAAGEVAEGEQRLRERQAREAERHRIAREIHDVLAHRISLLSLHAGALEYRPDVSPEETAKAAGVIRAAAQDALVELRDVIGVMRTGAGEDNEPPQPGITDIPKLIERFRDAGVRVDLEHDQALEAELSTTAGRTIYRVVQEGLTNASKHAPGARVSISIERSGATAASVTVVNPLAVNGRLAAVTLSSPGVGLVGLAERVELAGGKVNYAIEDETRFRLDAEVPIGAS
jgi:signal transduction histidine kinase